MFSCQRQYPYFLTFIQHCFICCECPIKQCTITSEYLSRWSLTSQDISAHLKHIHASCNWSQTVIPGMSLCHTQLFWQLSPVEPNMCPYLVMEGRQSLQLSYVPLYRLPLLHSSPGYTRLSSSKERDNLVSLVALESSCTGWPVVDI